MNDPTCSASVLSQRVFFGRLSLALLTLAAVRWDGPDCPAGPPRQRSLDRTVVATDAGGPASAKRVEPAVQVGHYAALRHVVFSPDKKRFATTAGSSWGPDRRVLLWDTATGEKLREFPAAPHHLKPQFCLDGKAVVIGGNVWDVATGRLRHVVLEDQEVPVTFRISTDGRRLVVGVKGGASGNAIRAVQLETGEVLVSLATSDLGAADNARDANDNRAARRDPLRIRAVGCNPEGDPLALLSGARDDRVVVWNVATGKRQAKIETDQCQYAEFSPNGNYVVVRWDDVSDPYEWVTVFDANTGREVASWSGQVVSWSGIGPVIFSADGRYCFGRGPAQQITLFDLQTGKAVRHFAGHTEPIVTMRLSDDGKTLETRSHDVAQRWDVNSGKLLKAFANSEEVEEPKSHWRSRRVRTGVAPDVDGKTILFGDRIFDAASGKRRHRLRPVMSIGERASPHAASAAITHSEFLPGGKTALVAWQGRGNWCQAALFDAASGEMINRLAMVPTNWTYDLQWNRDGRRALTCVNGLHQLWDVEHGRPLQTIGRAAPGWNYTEPQIAFSPNGKFAYIYGRRYGAFFWDTETGSARHHDPPGQPSANQRALLDGKKHGQYYSGRSAVSHDGRLAASWYAEPEDRQHQVLVWKIDTGEVLLTLDHGPFTPIAPFFSPDDGHLVVVCRHTNRQVVTWDIESGEQLYSISPQNTGSFYGHSCVHFLPGGEQMLINLGQRELTLHDVATGKLIHRLVDTRPKPNFQRERRLREALLLSPDGRYAVADYSSEYAIVWDLRSGKQCLLIDRRFGGIIANEYFRFSDDGRKLVTCVVPLALWDLESGTLNDPQNWKEIPGLNKEYRPKRPGDGDRLLPVPPEILAKFADKIPENARRTGQTPDGKRLIVYHRDFTMAVWDIATAQPICRCYLFGNGGQWLTVLPDGECRGALEYVRYGVPSAN